MKKKNTEADYIKANRRGRREAEIGLYGKPLNHTKVWKSKKAYDRNRIKAAFKKNLPLFVVSSAAA